MRNEVGNLRCAKSGRGGNRSRPQHLVSGYVRRSPEGRSRPEAVRIRPDGHVRLPARSNVAGGAEALLFGLRAIRHELWNRYVAGDPDAKTKLIQTEVIEKRVLQAVVR